MRQKWTDEQWDEWARQRVAQENRPPAPKMDWASHRAKWMGLFMGKNADFHIKERYCLDFDDSDLTTTMGELDFRCAGPEPEEDDDPAPNVYLRDRNNRNVWLEEESMIIPEGRGQCYVGPPQGSIDSAEIYEDRYGCRPPAKFHPEVELIDEAWKTTKIQEPPKVTIKRALLRGERVFSNLSPKARKDFEEAECVVRRIDGNWHVIPKRSMPPPPMF